MTNTSNIKSQPNLSMKLPSRRIKTFGKKNKSVIHAFLGVKDETEFLNLSLTMSLNLGRRKNEKLERAYKFWADDLNKEIEQRREINKAKKQEKDRKIKKIKKLLAKAKSKKSPLKKIMKNTFVRDYSEIYDEEKRFNAFYNDLKERYEEGKNINIYKKGGLGEDYRFSFNYRFTNNFNVDFQNIFTSYIQIDSDADRIRNDTNFKIYMNMGEKITPKQMKQYFKQGTTNCFFLPIIEWAKDKMENAKSKATINRYRAMYNKLIKDNDKYFKTGVSEENMNMLSNEYRINIEVNTPFQKSFIVCKSDKKALTTFKYINTRIDHIDHNKIVNLQSEEVSQDKINDIGDDLIENNEYFTYSKSSFGYSKISTLKCSYVVKTDYRKCIDAFEKETGLIDCYIDDIENDNISDFIRQGVHFNETIDFKNDIYNENEINDKYANHNHIDMKKAYSNFHLSKYFKGFLGKPTDFRKCDSIVDLGYYKIENINFDNATPLLKTYNEIMNTYNDNIYPSPELEFLKDHGVSFNIVAGCWGINIDFRFTDDMINSKLKYPDEPSFYARYTGSMFYKNLYNNFFVKGDQELAEYLSTYEGEKDIVEYNEFKNEIQVSYKKQHNNHLSHICGFITSYMRLNVMEQLLNMNPNNIIKVVVDGIYYLGDTELYNCFRDEKKEEITKNIGSLSYISNNKDNIDFHTLPENREHHLTELHKGVGGSGKTHLNIYDKGFIRKLFIAPSWKLSRDKNKECGIDNQVWANLLSDDKEKINYFKRRYSVLIFDEISMMTDKAKDKILNTYADCKIIFCGDPNYQLPQFEKNEKPIKLTGFKNIIEYTENRRCKCDKLLQLLTFCRENINNNNLFNIVKQSIPTITKEELKKKYTIKDLILTRSIVKRDFYSSLLTDSKKYYVLKTDRTYCKGEILYNKPNENYTEAVVKDGVKTDGDYELRNAYTIHSIQGETAKNKIYIHNSFMEATAIYTALSRAEHLHQINIIV